jgi:thermitase
MRFRRLLGLGALALALALAPGAHADGAPARPAALSSVVDQALALGYHPSSVLVGFTPGVTTAQRTLAHTLTGGTVARRMANLNLEVVQLPAGVDPRQAVARYQAQPGVAYATLNRVARLLSEPNDVLFGQQWGFDNTNDFDIDAPEAWDRAYGPGNFPSSGGTRVAIIDTGIDRGHAEFAVAGKVQSCAGATTGLGIVINGSCQDDNLHGTHVAGTVGATTNNTAGVAGTAPDAQLAVFKALNAGGVGFYADVVAGIDWAIQSGARVISMSLGGPDDPALAAAVQRATNAGLLLVAAAGNDGDETLSYPGAYPQAFSVAATNSGGALADFSTCNAAVDIAAPGEDIWSTLPGNAYGPLNGTSMATPHVSGAAALVMSERGLSAAQTRQVLTSTGVGFSTGRGGSCPGSLPHLNLNNALA